MPEAPPALLALIETGVSLARRSSSGKLLFGRLHGVVHGDLLPARIREPVRRELEDGFRATATPVDAKTVERTLKSAWRKPHGKLVEDLDPEPLSVSSTAVVHAASHDDRPVALKVLRPGVATTVRSELALLDILAAPIAAVFRALDVSGVLREIREAALDELDLEHEGDQQQRVRRALRRVDGVVVPEVVGELAGTEVLATERLEGITLAAAVADDPEAIARRLVEAHVVAWREAGLVMTDCRPSHVVQLADGRTGLLGTGVARSVPRDRATAGVSAFGALADADPEGFVSAVSDGLGVLDEDTARAAHPLLREVLGPIVEGPARLDGPALAEMTVRGLRRIGPLLAIGAKATPQPADLAALRMLGQLAATLSRLEVTEDWPRLARGVVNA
jgi:predicted unusual protein kinase regulating ubiquinone biosynthesis (AarF/ABC1/UbiB family)